MHSIEFDSEEVEVLREILKHSKDEMDVEVHRTDNIDYKRMLRRRRDILEQALSKLGAPPFAAAA